MHNNRNNRETVIIPKSIIVASLLATNSCSHKIQGINVCLQNHHRLCTPLPKFTTSDLCASRSLRSASEKWTTHYCTIPKRHKITFTDFFNNCSLQVEWPDQLNLSSWILTHLQETAKNTFLPSLFDPLTLVLSILILFYLSVFFVYISFLCIYLTLLH